MYYLEFFSLFKLLFKLRFLKSKNLFVCFLHDHMTIRIAVKCFFRSSNYHLCVLKNLEEFSSR